MIATLYCSLLLTNTFLLMLLLSANFMAGTFFMILQKTRWQELLGGAPFHAVLVGTVKQLALQCTRANCEHPCPLVAGAY